MSHSVVQKNHLKSAFMLIFVWIIAKLKSSIISKHPVLCIISDKRLGTDAERTWELDKGKVIWWWYIISQLKVLDMLKKCLKMVYISYHISMYVYIPYHNIITHILLV